MIKMIVSSFYNALIDEEEAIPTSTMLEIERIRKKKILFCILTNRDYQEVLDYNKDFPFIDYIISLNGSYVYDVNKEKVLYKNKLSTSNIEKIEKIFSKEEIYYYGKDKCTKNKEELEEVYKIEIPIKDREEKNKLLKLNVTTSCIELNKELFLEITSSKASMFTGVDQIGLKTGINLKEIVAVCANESDASLVNNITKSYIVENSCPLLKGLTKKVLNSNNEKGVEQLLRKI